ncbi:MAG: protein translocase subunit SecD, partial [Clostridia bacterium]|nr:protein translocase subunit SecD [Clostridia bacterium]
MNYSRTANIAKFVLLILCIVAICAVAVCGIYFNDNTQLKGIFDDGAVRLGLDLAGGSVITYAANTEDTGDKLDSGMESVLTVIRQRLDSEGLTEALCYRAGDNMVTIEIPDVDDPNQAAADFMQTAKLTFRNENNEIVLEGQHIESARNMIRSDDSGAVYYVELNLTPAGETIFAEATKHAASSGTTIGIYLDEELISNPGVDSKYSSEGITGGTAVIEGNFDAESSQHLANLINAGALKYDLKTVEQRTVGATLGQNSLSTSLIAGAIGLLLVVIFMCIYYKIPGMLASISLLCYTGLFAFVLVITEANLTLAGIAGVVLSIGMAVDANVVIFERMKEELDGGKSVKAAIKGGFHRAFSAIIDSNVTTLIACLVLYFLGTGTIKGFALTLFIGVVISLFTSLLITRALLNLFCGMGVSKPSLYRSLGKKKVVNAEAGAGGAAAEAENDQAKSGKFHFIKNKMITLAIVAVVLLTGILSFAIRGFNIDIEFSGGSEIQIVPEYNILENDILDSYIGIE